MQWNQVPVTLGNFVGGAVLMACVYSLAYGTPGQVGAVGQLCSLHTHARRFEEATHCRPSLPARRRAPEHA